MRRLQMPHPDEEQLLRYSDGELPGRATSQVDSHLKACWQCRTTLEEIEKTVGASVRYRSTVLQRHLPAPPAPWTDIYGCFAEIDKSMNRPSLADRLGRILAWPIHHPKQWAPAMLALLIICGLVYRYRLTPSVQAAELLQKAILASDSHPAKPHLLRIRTGAHTVTRRTGTTQMLASNAVDQETLNSLQTLFHGANYNWDDPLSAKSYSAWRDQLSAKRDQLTKNGIPSASTPIPNREISWKLICSFDLRICSRSKDASSSAIGTGLKLQPLPTTPRQPQFRKLRPVSPHPSIALRPLLKQHRMRSHLFPAW